MGSVTLSASTVARTMLAGYRLIRRFVSKTLLLTSLSVMLSWLLSGWLALPAMAAEPGNTSSASAGTENLVSRIAAQLGRAHGIRARFTQTQTLAAMQRPLLSTGSLVFFREQGVVWRIETPYKAVYVITDAGVSERGVDGQRVGGKGTNGARGVAQVSRMMRAMLGGDLSALYSQFDVHAEGSPARWHLQLTPNQPQLAQAIKGLQMEGGAYLQTLRITLANGDVTLLDFTDNQAIDALSPADHALFEAP